MILYRKEQDNDILVEKHVFANFYNIRKNKNKLTQKTCAYLWIIFLGIAMLGFQKI